MRLLPLKRSENHHSLHPGGKGENLIKLMQGGFPVPPFMVISSEVFNGMLQRQKPLISTCVAGIRLHDPEAVQRAADTIATTLKDLSLPDEIETRLTHFAALVQKPSATFAVRSSAFAEDRGKTSFAGLFSTRLHVESSSLQAAVIEVFQSLFSPEVLAYCLRKNVDINKLEMSVIVQQMAEAETSGIVFTVNPAGNLAYMLVTTGKGFGDAVVEDKTDTLTQLIDRQSGMVYRQPSRAPLHLTPEQFRELHICALNIEAHFGYPQDIEFSFDRSGKLWILQSRNITTLPEGELKILDNTNIAESYPGITLPLSFSFARLMYGRVFGGTVKYFRPSKATMQTLANPLSEMIALVEGRVYYQLHHWYRIISVVTPSGNRLQEWEQFIGIRSNTARSVKKNRWKTLRMAMITLRLVLRYPAIMRRFYRDFEKAYTGGRVVTDTLHRIEPDRKTLLKVYRELEQGLTACWPATLLNDFFVFRAYAACSRMVDRITGTTDGSIMPGLLCGIRGVESEWPVMEVLRIKGIINENPAFRTLFRKPAQEIMLNIQKPEYLPLKRMLDAYTHLYGDRTLEELKLEVPNFRQDPEGLIRLIQTQLNGDATQETFREQQEQIRGAAEATMERSLWGKPLRRLAFGLMLHFTRATVRNRENMRLRRSRAYGVVKELFAFAGQLMANEGLIEGEKDVFYLDPEDVLPFLEGEPVVPLHGKVAQRKEGYDGYRKLDLPDRLMYRGDEIPVSSGATDFAAPAGTLTGLGISKGVVTAPALVLTSPDYNAPVDGKILVTRSTDPGWVFLMTRAAGIISEKGSPLSHTAIVGRELGIPVIVAVPGATQQIRSGEMITMDGEKGVVLR
jgi:rifampicin phosphotransferase